MSIVNNTATTKGIVFTLKIFCIGLSITLLPVAHAQTTNLYWGDTHLHTANSTDAYASGNLQIGPEEAYRFAKGQPIIHPLLGIRLKITRPLDFLVVADHSDYLGIQVYLQRDDPRISSSERGQQLRSMVLENPASIFRMIFSNDPQFTPEQLLETYKPIQMQPWLDEITAAENHNEPGVFTAFAGWEWSSHKDNKNLHRVVFSPADAEQLQQFFPYSNLDSERPEALWNWLETTANAINSDFIAIPHNSNMSTGLMFATQDSEGQPFTESYARTRDRWEPVMEITQVKGTSEVHPALAPNDEFSEFEIFRRLFMNSEPIPETGDYARSALKAGLEIEDEIGINPFKLGFIGSSDTHTGLSFTDEDNYFGAVSRDVLPATRQAAPRNRPADASAALNAWELSASGLAAVWATENNRNAITESFKRKEVYATSGTRIALRVFAGFNFIASDASANEIAEIGYSKGIPMGADLSTAPDNKNLQLLIHAVKDSVGANLDRIQVIKGWLDADGRSQEKIFDVSWAGERTLNAKGKLAAVGNTVDVESARYSNSIGTAQLSTVWEDPDFNPATKAFYYVRVLEIPTPRHQVYDAVALGLDPTETGQVSSIQERAWSSPIWYSPEL